MRLSLKLIAFGLILIALGAFLSGCSQINALGIEDGENAVGCGKVSTGAIGGIFTGQLDGVTAEVSSNTDTSNWTAEQWAELLEICD